MVGNQIRQFDRRCNFPRDNRAVDYTFGKCFRNGGQGHTNRCCAKFVQHVGDNAGRTTQFQTFHVFQFGNTVFGVDHARAMNPCAQNFHVTVFAFLQVCFDHFLECFCCRDRIRHHERKFENLGAREAAGCVANNRHGDIGNAVNSLIEQCGRRTTQSHRIVMLDFHFASGSFFNCGGPGFQDVLRHCGRRRQELV